MKKTLMIALAACAAAIAGCIVAGCATKSRTVDMMGMWASESGQVAIGKVSVQAIPEGTDAALIKYTEDNAWFTPTMKLHEIGITLTGSNSVDHAEKIVDSICTAFVQASPAIAEAASKTTYGTTQMDVMKNATDARKAIELGKQAVQAAKDAAKKDVDLAKIASATNALQSATSAANCANGTCSDGTCVDGACTTAK